MNYTIYCGSSFGNDPDLNGEVTRLGELIGQAGDSLVYGGSKTGLMGTISGSVSASGGKVIGVELRRFADEDLTDDRLSDLIITDTLSERKQKMIDLGDAFVALPGGAGTLDEISEIITLKNIGILNKPCIFFNWKGYYEPLIEFYGQMKNAGFLKSNILEIVSLAEDASEVIRAAQGEASEYPDFRNEEKRRYPQSGALLQGA